MTKKEFMAKYLKLINDDSINSITVVVKLPGLVSPEYITNNRDNFYIKLDYYDRSYDDDMRLINNEDVYILDVKGA